MNSATCTSGHKTFTFIFKIQNLYLAFKTGIYVYNITMNILKTVVYMENKEKSFITLAQENNHSTT